MRKPKWSPRASAIGHYMQCSYRAAFDRALHDGALQLPDDVRGIVEENKKSSPYADLGTCIHWHLQSGLGCVWPIGETDADHAPSPEQILNASTLFRSNVEATDAAIRDCAVRAAAHMPKAPDNLPWLAEVGIKTKHYTGHIDFLSQNRRVLVDLKTTSRPPDHGAVKPAHLAQVLAYASGVDYYMKAKTVDTVVVLYVDSIGAKWALPVVIDCTDPGIMEYMEHVQNFVAYLRSPTLYKTAFPNIGHACTEWCPYTGICRDIYRPKPGEIKQLTATAPTMSQRKLI